jgi:ubiquinone/menaquinone biosynthesis C-methylase UbiE
MSTDDVKAQVQARFGKYAQHYVTSQTHAAGADLERLLQLAQPQPDWVMLDVATGGGHTARHFAPHVARVVAADFALPMLLAARDFIAGHRISNITFVAADGEHLPFADRCFDAVTCRIALHHFPDVFRAACEMTRVLKPGGLLLVQDHVLPDDEWAARYINAFERLRDPSHHRAYSETEWRGLYLDVGLSIVQVEIVSKTAMLVSWAQRQGCTPATIERLQVMLAQAPRAVADWLQPRCIGTADAAFEHRHILIVGKKT